MNYLLWIWQLFNFFLITIKNLTKEIKTEGKRKRKSRRIKNKRTLHQIVTFARHAQSERITQIKREARLKIEND